MSRAPRRPPPAPRPIEEYPDPMTCGEVAEFLRCSAAMVRTLEADGLRPVRWGAPRKGGKGGVVRFFKSDVLGYIAQKRGIKQEEN